MVYWSVFLFPYPAPQSEFVTLTLFWVLPNDFLLLLPLYVLVAVADTIINLRYQNDCLSLRECIICQDLASASYSNLWIYSNSMILGYCSMTLEMNKTCLCFGYEKVGIWLGKVFAFFEECHNLSSIICVLI